MTTYFSDLLNSPTDQNPGSSERPHVLSEQTRSGVPKFKSTPPSSLPLSPTPLFSPSYFSLPAGFSLAELLDSPVLLNSSNILPSPTTGSFAGHQGFNWKSSNGENQQQNVKSEDESFSSFSFQTQPQGWSFQEKVEQDGVSSGMSMSVVKTENPSSNSMQSFTPENIAGVLQNNLHKSGLQSDYNNNCHPQQPHAQILSKRSDDGYNWRKYGQKQVKGSENPRSYYKCTYPNCPTKKKVERSFEGHVTEIVYKGTHNHPKPQATKRNSSSSLAIPPSNHVSTEIQDSSYSNGQMDSVATPDNSSISMGDDDFEQSSQKSKCGGDHEFGEDEPNAKRWKIEGENEGISAAGSRTVREPRIVVQTTSDIDILDDGYRWRKYGQKVVKGNPNPRSYYKCTNPGCPVRKHVERASQDLRAVITTYEGKHNHDVPAARGSTGSHSINKPIPMPTNAINNNNNNNNIRSAIRSSDVTQYSTNNFINNSLHSFNPEMLQTQGSFEFSMESYMNMNQQPDNVFSSRASQGGA